MLWLSLGLNWALGLALVAALRARAVEAERARRADAMLEQRQKRFGRCCVVPQEL
jgi:hypothetical protein